MEEKRYSIVRVDMRCPYGLEETFCSNDCHQCRLGYGYYGDTKEQLIRKILQVMMRKYTISYLRTTKQDKINPKHFKSAIDYYLETAKEIVEFLGVEE